MRFRRKMIGLALLLVLSGTPARQAEAAADLARTYAETDGGGSDRIAEVDGGVGDDHLEATRADDLANPAAPVVATLFAPPFGHLTAAIDPRAGRLGLTPRLPLAPLPPLAPPRRCAWLQRFQF